ncbi:MerR family transcriptional regulator [Actinoplanes sp. CA-131856]
MRQGLTIGEFATLTHLSVRTLRRYHEAGLLEPRTVDPSSGYRYYSPEQIPAAQVIHRLRELDVPLAEVRSILATDDPRKRADLVTAHLHRLEDELDRTRRAVASLRRLLTPDPEDLAVTLRSEPPRTVAAVEGLVDSHRVLPWYAESMRTLDARYPPGERTGPPGGLYANELFTTGKGRMTVFHPVRTPHPDDRLELPPTELAVTVHQGPHDDIEVTYSRLGAWVVEHALAVNGPVHETYLIGPRDTLTPTAWRTEIGWPVFHLSTHT